MAFIGDQGVGNDARAVLSLIADEGTDLLMIQGDFGYDAGTASTWEANLNEVLGRDFPVLSVVGNHENYEWPLYQSMIGQRIDRVDGLECSGEIGVKAVCSYGNIEVVHVAPGIHEAPGVDGDDDYAGFIRSAFARPSDRWRICSWHKNMRHMQIGSKGDSTGWGVYDACLDAGAMVATAHSHNYSRTHLLSDFRNRTVVHRNSEMSLAPGRSLAFVSGLGGRDATAQERGGDWWASIYTATQGATYGALFCSFDTTRASCYFKAIDGAVPDQFTLSRSSRSSRSPAAVAAPSSADAPPGSDDAAFVFARTDTEELRWIDRDDSGRLGSIWIDPACAERLGGARVSGDWGDLMSLAPAFDAIDSPCAPRASIVTDADAGFVFARTDTEELRWIDRDDSGRLGSIWIDPACAERLGGARMSGDWGDLMSLAPAFDAIDSPCAGAASSTKIADATDAGFVFARTDTEELRWIDRDDSGRLGSIWIDPACAERLGGAQVSGDWGDLMTLAPAFDAIDNPCS